MIRNVPRSFTDPSYLTYGSSQRDEALVLQTLSDLGLEQDAFRIARRVAENLGSTSWMSTQTTAWS